MNFISHHETAIQFNPTLNPDFLTGTFITDIKRISGAKNVLMELSNPDMLEGIKFHQQTNLVFDSLPQIIELEEDLKNSFNKFLPWRTSMQASHVGKDLLFDSIQFKDQRIIKNFLATLEKIMTNEVQFSNVSNPTPIIDVVDWILSNGPPRYDDPEVATHRLYGTLYKTRTPIDPLYFEDVIKVMEQNQTTVMKIGSIAMNQTIEKLKSTF